MKKETVVQLHSEFESLTQADAESGVEFWWARDLQVMLGYSQWRNFEPVIEKAITACKTAGFDPGDHFARRMVEICSHNATSFPKTCRPRKTSKRSNGGTPLTRRSCRRANRLANIGRTNRRTSRDWLAYESRRVIDQSQLTATVWRAARYLVVKVAFTTSRSTTHA